MNRSVAIAMILSLTVPMALGLLLRHLNHGPTIEDTRARFLDPKKDIRCNAVEWARRLKSPALVDDLIPLLEDKSPRLRLVTAQALGSTASREAIQPIYDAILKEEDLGNRKQMMWKLSNLQFPQVLPLMHELKLHGREDMREEAGRVLGSTMWGMNKEVTTFSLTGPVVSELGRSVHSQAVLWETGRELAARAPAETFQPDAIHSGSLE